MKDNKDNLFKKLHERLAKGCEQLKWEFKENTDVVNRFDLDAETAFGFFIDGCEYYVCKIISSPLPTLDTFYAAAVVRYRGNRDEPPSEDEAPLKGNTVDRPESLVARILETHFGIRLQWVLEGFLDDEMEEEK